MTKDYYETTDLGLAASLCCVGYRVVDVDKSNPKRVVFCFENNFELKTKVSEFWDNSLLIPASTLLENIRLLKSRIYA
jgi:hypothetical protein